MDQQQWKTLQAVLRRVTRLVRPLPRARYSDYLILRFYFWAVRHDRPMSWAIDRDHYNRIFRPRQWPSLSQLNRRIASDRFQSLLQRVHQQLGQCCPAKPAVAILDGKALTVSPVSADRDARSGYIGGALGKGYKLHALVNERLQILLFSVMPLNCHERNVAHLLLNQVPSLDRTLVLADGNYDSHKMYKQVDSRNGRLVTFLRGRAKHAVTRRQMGKARRRVIDLWTRHPSLMNRLYQKRKAIERVFGRLVCTPGLLGPLPAFVRGLARVRRWVGAKICLYHARLMLNGMTQPAV